MRKNKMLFKPDKADKNRNRSSGNKKQKEKREREKRLTAQNTIAYKEMGRDGICKVQGKTYSKTIRFYDINYQLAQNEDKNSIFENWCDFLNYFDSTIHFQLSFINHKSSMKEYERIIQIKPQNDAFDDVRMEYAQMLKSQLAKGNNGLVKSKYITFSIEAESWKKAKPRLERIETDILNNFKVLGVMAYPLSGEERLQILYETFNPDVGVPFQFDYKQLLKSGLTTKDFVAPSSFLFKSGKDFMMGDTIGAASYLQILAPELTDKMLAEFLDIDKNLIVNLHVQSVDQMKAIKLVKSKVTDINRMKIEEQKKAVRAGYDMDILPSDLNTYGGEATRLLEDLQSRNERMFLVTALFLNTAESKQELENAIFQTAGVAQKYNCALKRLDYMQEEGLMSSVPLGVCHVPIKRALTTTSTAIFVPFTTQELFMSGESLYYGLNALSNNMIMVDRKKLKNPNGLIIGTPGAGKSFAAKREITNAFFVTDDDIIIGDPEGEYSPVTDALGGQVIHISPNSKDYINPMDINMDYSDDDNPLGVKSDFILSLCELIMGSRNGIEAEEKSVIDRCLPLVYQKYFENPVPENMPILGDLYNCLRSQKEPQAQRIATALEIYVNGSLKVFNHRTNVQLDNRIIYEYTEILMPQGTKVLSVMDGTVKDISDGSITLENEKGYKVKITNCSNIRVSEGAEVKEGDVIAKVNSQGSVRISFTYHRTSFNPYFYLDVGEGSVYGAGGDVSAKAGALITEAMKYRGVPYVWGGYSPSGFDCSGFVSYAINHCGAGWNIGRLTADGLRGICRTIPSSQAQAGDLIFFQGTYDTPGASHVGIYLGNGEMIHCGKPVQVTSINSSYWQQHFLSFGRLP